MNPLAPPEPRTPQANLLYNPTKNGLGRATRGPEVPKIFICANNFANPVYYIRDRISAVFSTKSLTNCLTLYSLTPANCMGFRYQIFWTL
jgi:hypothetical protein